MAEKAPPSPPLMPMAAGRRGRKEETTETRRDPGLYQEEGSLERNLRRMPEGEAILAPEEALVAAVVVAAEAAPTEARMEEGRSLAAWDNQE